eukprot:Phypoly_transcript_01032.p1 GENE.Phypoly_transcript_01032~~Phypoly_transcript_01032.p1  ORF type:complete len:1029 (+),score=296.73 Phypoly_transcript_01032:673-3759(+)
MSTDEKEEKGRRSGSQRGLRSERGSEKESERESEMSTDEKAEKGRRSGSQRGLRSIKSENGSEEKEERESEMSTDEKSEKGRRSVTKRVTRSAKSEKGREEKEERESEMSTDEKAEKGRRSVSQRRLRSAKSEKGSEEKEERGGKKGLRSIKSGKGSEKKESEGNEMSTDSEKTEEIRKSVPKRGLRSEKKNESEREGDEKENEIRKSATSGTKRGLRSAKSEKEKEEEEKNESKTGGNEKMEKGEKSGVKRGLRSAKSEKEKEEEKTNESETSENEKTEKGGKSGTRRGLRSAKSEDSGTDSNKKRRTGTEKEIKTNITKTNILPTNITNTSREERKEEGKGKDRKINAEGDSRKTMRSESMSSSSEREGEREGGGVVRRGSIRSRRIKLTREHSEEETTNKKTNNENKETSTKNITLSDTKKTEKKGKGKVVKEEEEEEDDMNKITNKKTEEEKEEDKKGAEERETKGDNGKQDEGKRKGKESKQIGRGRKGRESDSDSTGEKGRKGKASGDDVSARIDDESASDDAAASSDDVSSGSAGVLSSFDEVVGSSDDVSSSNDDVDDEITFLAEYDSEDDTIFNYSPRKGGGETDSDFDSIGSPRSLLSLLKTESDLGSEATDESEPVDIDSDDEEEDDFNDTTFNFKSLEEDEILPTQYTRDTPFLLVTDLTPQHYAYIRTLKSMAHSLRQNPLLKTDDALLFSFVSRSLDTLRSWSDYRSTAFDCYYVLVKQLHGQNPLFKNTFYGTTILSKATLWLEFHAQNTTSFEKLLSDIRLTLTLDQITSTFTEINKFLETQQETRRETEAFFGYFEKLRETIRELLEDVQKTPSSINYDGDGESGSVNSEANMAAWSKAKKRKAQLQTSLNKMQTEKTENSKITLLRDRVRKIMLDLNNEFLSKQFSEFPMWEAFYTNRKRTEKVLAPWYQSDLQSALANPQKYLKCKCCDPKTPKNATQEDLAIVYGLYREAGKYINLHDWLVSFAEVCGSGDDPEAVLPRFMLAADTLNFLGLVQPTTRRVDHVVKLTW